MASDLESVTVAIANQNLNEKEVVKNGDHSSLNSGEDKEDAGGFGQLSGSNGLASTYARMPVEREALRYNMNHPSRGHCVIFNHRIFDSHTGLGACRGEGLDPGTTLVSTGPKDETDAGALSYKIPNSADYLICWSTVPGHFSWRNTTNGSWFIQSLVHVLNAQSKHDDLLSMMTDVNRYMIIHFESNCPSQQHMHGKKQVASIVSTLMRKVYLTPKY